MILRARLTVGGVEVDISGYQVKTIANGMGRSITVALSEPNPDLIPEEGAVIKFEIGAGKETAPGLVEFSWKTYLDTGKQDGRRFALRWIADEYGGFPGDVIEFDSFSPLMDKLGLAPLYPLTMFDPDKINKTDIIPDDLSLIRYYENGESNPPTPLSPILEPIQGMRLYDVLNRIYANATPPLDIPTLKNLKDLFSRDFADESKGITGLGFNTVICNLPNFPIDRVDFSITSGYHNPIKTLLSNFEPIAFEDGYNNLYILDPDYPLPPGVPLRAIDFDCDIEDITEQINPEGIVNAYILSYNQEGSGILSGGEIPDIKFITEPPLVTGSGRSYLKREVFRKITEFKDINTGALRRVEENEITTSTYAYRDAIFLNGDGSRSRGNGEVKLVSQETIQNRYKGKTKSGHTKTIAGIFTNPETGLDDYDDELYVEEQVLQWETDLAHPGASNQTKTITTVRGLVVQETKEDGLTVFTPILRAVNSGIIESTGQLLLTGAISTTIEELRKTANNQTNVEVTLIDHLTGGIEPIPTQARPGATSNYTPAFAYRKLGGARPGTIAELILDLESVELYGLRIAQSIDIKNLDPEEGRKLCRRKLAKTKKPPRLFSVNLPGIDFALRRGSLLAPILTTSDRNLILLGDTITGRNIGTEAESHKHSFEAREVLNGNY